MKQYSKDKNYDLIYDFSIGAEEKTSEIIFRIYLDWHGPRNGYGE